MKKFGKVLLSGALCLVMLLLVLPTITPRVSALTGDGTSYNPYKPTTYAEFKRVLEMPGEHYIVVDRMDNTTGLSYIDISDEYTSGDCAINIPAGAYKDVTINCDLDFRTNSLNRFLYSFIGNRGKLYLDGRGSITASMNSAGFPSAVILNYNTLEITRGVSLWGAISSASQPGSFARAIYNYDNGKLLITAESQGTFYGVNASAVLNESTRAGGYIAGGLFQASGGLGYTTYTSYLTISGGTFQGIAVTDHANLLRLGDIMPSDYKIYTVDNKETISSALRSTDKSVYIAKAKKIRSVELSCTEPKYGAMVSKITTKTAGVNVASYDWDTGTSYTQGRHVLQIRLEPQSGYSFDKSCKVTLNGDELDITGLDHTVDGYITLECAYAVADGRPQLNGATFLVSGYEVGKKIADAKITTQSSAIKIRSYTWQDGTNQNVSGNFKADRYGLTIYFDVSDSYQCTNVDKSVIKLGSRTAYSILYGGTDFDASQGDLAAVFYLNDLGNVVKSVEFNFNYHLGVAIKDLQVVTTTAGINLATYGSVVDFALYDNATGKQVTSGTIQNKEYLLSVAFICDKDYTKGFDEDTDVTLNGLKPIRTRGQYDTILADFKLAPLNHTHTAAGTWKSSTTNHWQLCSDCQAEINSAKHTGGKSTCRSKAQCSVCKAVYGELADHSWSKTWDHSDEKGHYHRCTTPGCSELSTVAAHNPGPAATETTAQSCKDCGYVIKAALSHTHKISKVEAKAATCTDNGNQEYYVCSGCSDWFSDAAGTKKITDRNVVVLTSFGHEFAPATCIAPAACKHCNATEGTALGHTDADGDGQCDVCAAGAAEQTDPMEQTEPTETEQPDTTEPAEPETKPVSGDQGEASSGVPWWIIVLAIVTLGTAGALVTILIRTKKQGNEA